MESNCPSSGKIPSFGLDFRSSDDAWYAVQLALQDETLIIKYCDFDDEFNERFNAGDFKNLNEVEAFAERFRPTSVQLQDHECSKVIEGIPVCVCHEFSKQDIRFYDAIVEAVIYKDHKFAKDEEVCTCTFVVFWEHGPNAGMKTSTNIEHICLLQPGNAQANPILASFMRICREKKVEMASHDSDFLAENTVLGCDATTSHKRGHSTIDGYIKSTSCKSQTCHFKETKTSKRSVITAWTREGQSSIHQQRNGQDVDLGGKSFCTENPREVGLCHFILIDNLEKDLVPSTIVDFIKREICISSQAYVFPCLSSESYTRGIISVDSQEKLLKLSDFLHNPAHMILSSKGRPWVITEKELRYNAVGTALGKLESDSKIQPCDKKLKVGSKLEIATLGMDEYVKGKQLMELHMEFADHIKQLHNKLASEERKIMQS